MLRFTETCSMHVRGITCPCFLGVYASEQVAPREVVIDVDLDLPLTAGACSSDRVDQVLNYEIIATLVIRVASARRYALVESLCHAILEAVAALVGGPPLDTLADGLPAPQLAHPVTARKVVVRVTKAAPVEPISGVTIEMAYRHEETC